MSCSPGSVNAQARKPVQEASSGAEGGVVVDGAKVVVTEKVDSVRDMADRRLIDAGFVFTKVCVLLKVLEMELCLIINFV